MVIWGSKVTRLSAWTNGFRPQDDRFREDVLDASADSYVYVEGCDLDLQSLDLSSELFTRIRLGEICPLTAMYLYTMMDLDMTGCIDAFRT